MVTYSVNGPQPGHNVPGSPSDVRVTEEELGVCPWEKESGFCPQSPGPEIGASDPPTGESPETALVPRLELSGLLCNVF